MSILSEVKASHITNFISEINSQCDEFALILKYHNANTTYMRAYIAKFLLRYEIIAADTNLIKHVDAAFLGSFSLIKVYIDFLRGVSYEQTYNMRTTANKYIFDFYVSIMLVVGKSHGLRELLQVLEDHYADGNLKLYMKHQILI